MHNEIASGTRFCQAEKRGIDTMTAFQILTVIILLVFYGCYYAKKIEQKTKGIRTTQIVRGKQGIHLYIEAAMGIAAFSIVIAEVISIMAGWSLFPVWLRIAGLIISALGVTLFITAMLTMRDSWRAGVSKDKTELVTTGIFKISRNPAFLGFDLMYLGVLMVFFNWILLIFSAFAILTLHLQIVINEEDAMLSAFGDEYLNYKKKVNRYFGRK